MQICTTISHTCYNLTVEFALISYKSYRSCASKIVSSCPLEFPFSCPCNLRSLFSTSTDGPCSNQKNRLTLIVVQCEASPFLFLDTLLMQSHKYLRFAGL